MVSTKRKADWGWELGVMDSGGCWDPITNDVTYVYVYIYIYIYIYILTLTHTELTKPYQSVIRIF